jgi:hypothetical protein
MFKGSTEHVLTYFKCQDGKDAKEEEAGYATLMGTQSLAMNAKVSGSKAVDGFCYQHQFKGQSSEGAGISLATDYASDFDAVELAAHHKSKALRLEVIKEGHEEEERRSPPAELQSLFQKQPVDINPKKLQWSKYTQEQAQRGGCASFVSQSKAAPTDTFVMADGITKPNNQWQETSSSGGLVGGLASVEANGEQMRNGGLAGGPTAALKNAQRRRNEDDQGAYTTERLEGDNAQYAIGLGLGVNTKRKSCKPSYASPVMKSQSVGSSKQVSSFRRGEKGNTDLLRAWA